MCSHLFSSLPSFEVPAKGFDASKGCDSDISRGTLSGILFSHIPQLETIEQVSSIQEVSYELDFHSRESADQGMLYGINRLERCLSTYSYSPKNSWGRQSIWGRRYFTCNLRPCLSSAPRVFTKMMAGDCGNPVSGRSPKSPTPTPPPVREKTPRRSGIPGLYSDPSEIKLHSGLGK